MTRTSALGEGRRSGDGHEDRGNFEVMGISDESGVFRAAISACAVVGGEPRARQFLSQTVSQAVRTVCQLFAQGWSSSSNIQSCQERSGKRGAKLAGKGFRKLSEDR